MPLQQFQQLFSLQVVQWRISALVCILAVCQHLGNNCQVQKGLTSVHWYFGTCRAPCISLAGTPYLGFLKLHICVREMSSQKRRCGQPDGSECVSCILCHLCWTDSRGRMDDLPSVPLSDHNMWYYPSHGHDSDEDLIVGSKTGNWGCKTAKGARWVRRGKITPWGPGMEDWEVGSLPSSCWIPI